MISLPFPAPLFYKGVCPFNVGNFEMSPIHVEDVSNIFVQSLTKKESMNKIFELGGKKLTWKEIVKLIAESCGKEEKIFIPVPIFPIKIASKIFDRFSSVLEKK